MSNNAFIACFAGEANEALGSSAASTSANISLHENREV